MHTPLQMHDFMVKCIILKNELSKPLIWQLECMLNKVVQGRQGIPEEMTQTHGI